MITGNQPGTITSGQDVLITHVFDAPREMVFRAWTDAEQLKKWFAPDGCTIQFKKADIRQGGSYHSCIYNPVHGDCWCKGSYLEVDFPSKIVFTMVVTDEHENDIEPEDAGLAPEWPVMTTVTITLTEANGKTKLVLHQTVAEALAKKTGAHPSWIEMLNRLDRML